MKLNKIKTSRQICLSLILLSCLIPSLGVLTEENLTSIDYVKKGLTEMAKSNNEEALKYYDQAISLDSTCGDAYYGKALVELKLENKGNALKAFNQAKEIFTQKNNTKVVQEIENQIVKINSQNTSNSGSLISDFNNTNSGNNSNNTNQVQQNISNISTNSNTLNNSQSSLDQLIQSANLKAKDKKYKEALQDYSQALIQDPKRADIYSQRAIVKVALKDKDGAINDCNQAISLMPDSPEAYKNRGNIKVTIKDYESGIQDLSKAKELFEKQGNINAYTAMVEEINKAKLAQSRPQTQASNKSSISGKDVLDTTNTVLNGAMQIGGMLMGI